MLQGGDRAAAMGVPFLYGLVEVVLVHNPEPATADLGVTPAAAQGVVARAQNADGDVSVKDKYTRVEYPARTGDTAATKPETTANTSAKPDGERGGG